MTDSILTFFGQECKYPIGLLLPKAPGHEIANYKFTRWLNEQFREAHMNARETLGYRQGRQKDLLQKNVFGEELKPGESLAFRTPKSKINEVFSSLVYNIIPLYVMLYSGMMLYNIIELYNI